jgi:hypothetical protein
MLAAVPLFMRSGAATGEAMSGPDRASPPSGPITPSVTASLAYLAPMNARPYNYMCEPPPGMAWHNCEFDLAPVAIGNARAVAPASIDAEGFELWDAPSEIKDFCDDEEVRRRYLPAVAELAKRVSGASRAFVFDHQVRQREAGRPPLTFGRDIDSTRPGAAGRVHNDYTEASGLRRLEIMAERAGAPLGAPRFAIVNIWRSIGGKVQDTPLAVCDARSISGGDLVASDLRYRDRTGEAYLVQRSARHRWWCFPEMDRHEALIFKQYDSQMSGVARFTPHSAFDLPEIAADAPLRQSIEVRCLVTYD